MIESWVWIAIGFLAFIFLMFLAYSQFLQASYSISEERSIKNFEELISIINNLCLTFTGNKREYKLSIGEMIDGIYASLNDYTEYKKEDLVNKIVNEEYSFGNYFCIKIKDRRLRCEKLYCNTSIFFIGSVPEKFSLSALVNKFSGKGKIFEYELLLERERDFVNISKKTEKEIVLMPDLVVLEIWNESNEIFYKARNNGNLDSGTSISKLFVDGNEVAVDELDSISPFSEVVDKFQYNFVCSANEHKIKVCLDVLDNVKESDENNNCKEITIQCYTPQPPVQGCNLDDVINDISKDSVFGFMSYLASSPRPAEGWGVDTSWNKQTRDWIKSKIEEFGLRNVRIHDFEYLSYKGYKGKGYNVIGEIGDGIKEVVIGSHRDSCGNAQYCQLTQGAVDNAAGSAVVMEIARVLTKNCKDSLKNHKFIFSFFDSEELGLLGSKAYVSRFDISNVIGMINLDCPQSFFRHDGMFVERSNANVDIDNVIDFCIGKVGAKLYGKTPFAGCCSDHLPFRRMGIFTLFPVGYPGRLCGDYYHTPRDKPDTIKPENLEIAAKFVSCVIVKLYGN